MCSLYLGGTTSSRGTTTCSSALWHKVSSVSLEGRRRTPAKHRRILRTNTHVCTYSVKVAIELGQHQSVLRPAGGSCLQSSWKHPTTASDGSIHRSVEPEVSHLRVFAAQLRTRNETSPNVHGAVTRFDTRRFHRGSMRCKMKLNKK